MFSIVCSMPLDDKISIKECTNDVNDLKISSIYNVAFTFHLC